MNASAKPYDGVNGYIRITDIDEDTSEFKKSGIVSPDAEIDESYRVTENDILFVRTGASTGKTYRYKPDDGRLYFAGFLIRAKISPYFDSKFIFYQTQSRRYKKWVQIMSMRSGQPGINSQEYASFLVNLPQKSEQKKISSLLSLIDQRISIQNKTIEDLIRLRTALYSSLFAKGRNISTILSDMGEYYSTMNLSKDDLSPSGQECILYGELFTTYGRVITEIKSRTNIGLSSGTTLSSSNDLLFPASTTVDALSLVSPSAISKNGVILGGDMFGIRLNENYNNRYMSRLLFHCYRRKLASYAQGSTIIHLHYRDIEKIKIKVHPKIEQDRIAEALDMLDNRIELEQKIVKEYSSQKNYLIKMMFI